VVIEINKNLEFWYRNYDQLSILIFIIF